MPISIRLAAIGVIFLILGGATLRYPETVMWNIESETLQKVFVAFFGGAAILFGLGFIYLSL